MIESITLDDVLIMPQFSNVFSRQDVSLSTDLCGVVLAVPVISANMDTVTGTEMSRAMAASGGIGCLHRFMSIERNISCYNDSIYGETKPMVSVGIGPLELERARALYDSGAEIIVLDVAHGAQLSVVRQVAQLKSFLKDNAKIIVGNFATSQSINDFKFHLGSAGVSAWKIGIGPGSACTTRVKTGVGVPQLSAVLDCAKNINDVVIADGGLRSPGDIAKVIGAGASAVMVGGLLSGTAESPGEIVDENGQPYVDSNATNIAIYKKYRGSASLDSYLSQGKDSKWRTTEGESFLVPYKGTVENIMKDIEGGLRSSLSYVGAFNIKEFQQKVVFTKVSGASIKENSAHGKR